MGYVYTPQEWEEGRIATQESFPEADKMLSSSLKEFYDKGLLAGANKHGSFLNGNCVPGSDIDVLVVMNYEIGPALRKTKEKIKNSTNVPVEWVTVLKDEAMNKQHRIGFYYGQQIQAFYKDGIIGRDPFLFIAPKDSWSNPIEESRKILEDQIENQLKSRANFLPYSEEYCKFLERITRRPLQTALNMLMIKRSTYCFQNNILSKDECCDLYRDEFPKIKADGLLRVLGMRKLYRQLLRERRGTSAEYKELLKEMEGVYEDAQRFMQNNRDYLISHDKP